MIDSLFPADISETDNEFHKNMRESVKVVDNTEDDIPFTEQEVKQIINEQNKSKSPGADGITADIVQQINNTCPQFLTDLYNTCLKLKHFPTQWKISVIKVIPKAGKNDYRSASSYRPISLLSVFAKVLEKLLIE